MAGDAERLIGLLFRQQAGRLVSVLTRRYGYEHVDMATDAVQDTFLSALSAWRKGGVPYRPEAWLMRVAINNMLNALKKAKSDLERRTVLMYGEICDSEVSEKEIGDSQLTLLLFCCGLDIPQRTRIMLTLYYLCGMSYAEIAGGMLMHVEAVKKSIFRNKEALKNFWADHDYQGSGLQRQIPVLLKTLYLLFNEGYKTTCRTGGVDLECCYNAMQLTLLIAERKKDGRLHALLALMFFHAARFPARMDGSENWITLNEQDRSLWSRELIAEGYFHLRRARELTDYADSYYLQALISSLHCAAANFIDTPWHRIVFLYRQLEALDKESVGYSLNRIIAQSYIDAVGLLEELDTLALRCRGPNLLSFYLAKAFLHQRDDKSRALTFYEAAWSLTASAVDRRYIERQIEAMRRLSGP